MDFSALKKFAAGLTGGGKKDAASDAAGKSGVNLSGKDKAGKKEEFKRDSARANKFYEHAQAVADARNYDYAIECYINGLKFDPDNLNRHEALFEVAKRRKVNGGKPAGMGEWMKGGKSSVEKMLNAEKVWAKDPLNAAALLPVMERSVEVYQEFPNLSMAEVTYWLGKLLLEQNQFSKRPTLPIYVKAKELFAKVGAWDKAVEACRLALSLSPDNGDLLADLKNLEAERTLVEGGYGQAGRESFRGSIKDEEKQKELLAEDAIGKTEQQVITQLKAARKAVEADPNNPDIRMKLVRALLVEDKEEPENEAVEILLDLAKKTGQYQYKMQAGDVRIRQLTRATRIARTALEADPKNAALRKAYDAVNDSRFQLELDEYTERVKNYPTDVSLKFELGKRLQHFKKTEEAISNFQEAQSDPKLRSNAMLHLGLCYVEKAWHEEAIETFRRAIDMHAMPDDKLGMELRYRLMDSLDRAARKEKSLKHATEARSIASQILQTNIKYKDIRDRLEKIKALIAELGEAASG